MHTRCTHSARTRAHTPHNRAGQKSNTRLWEGRVEQKLTYPADKVGRFPQKRGPPTRRVEEEEAKRTQDREEADGSTRLAISQANMPSVARRVGRGGTSPSGDREATTLHQERLKRPGITKEDLGARGQLRDGEWRGQ